MIIYVKVDEDNGNTKRPIGYALSWNKNMHVFSFLCASTGPITCTFYIANY